MENLAQEIISVQVRIEERQTEATRMALINKAYRAFKKDPKTIETSELNEADRNLVETFRLKETWQKDQPFQTYELSNNNQELGRLKKRLELLQAKEKEVSAAQTEGQGNKEIEFDGGTVVYNYPLDRVQIVYKSKPDVETRDRLKERGFNWSPTNGAWQRQLTPTGKWAAAMITKTTIA